MLVTSNAPSKCRVVFAEPALAQVDDQDFALVHHLTQVRATGAGLADDGADYACW